MGGRFEANSLGSDFHQLVQCRAAASVWKRRRGSIGSSRLDHGPLQVPLPPTPSTHLRTQRGCDKALSVYSPTVCQRRIWKGKVYLEEGGNHLVQITFKLQRPALVSLGLSLPWPSCGALTTGS